MQTWKGAKCTRINKRQPSIATSKEVKDLATHGDVIRKPGFGLLQDRHPDVVPANNFRQAFSQGGDGMAQLLATDYSSGTLDSGKNSKLEHSHK